MIDLRPSDLSVANNILVNDGRLEANTGTRLACASKPGTGAHGAASVWGSSKGVPGGRADRPNGHLVQRHKGRFQTVELEVTVQYVLSALEQGTDLVRLARQVPKGKR